MSGQQQDLARRPARRHGAVGAVVVDEQARVLLLERKVLHQGQWIREVRLPKGRLQSAEPDAKSALAEVVRLTGFDDIEVVADLGKAPVEYQARGVLYRRTEHYFLVRLRSQMKGDPRAPHGKDARAYHPFFAANFDEAARTVSFRSEQGAVLRARAWWPH